MTKINKDNVIDECYTMICRIEGALSSFTDDRLDRVVDNINDWQELVLKFRYDLEDYIEELKQND